MKYYVLNSHGNVIFRTSTGKYDFDLSFGPPRDPSTVKTNHFITETTVRLMKSNKGCTSFTTRMISYSLCIAIWERRAATVYLGSGQIHRGLILVKARRLKIELKRWSISNIRNAFPGQHSLYFIYVWVYYFLFIRNVFLYYKIIFKTPHSECFSNSATL